MRSTAMKAIILLLILLPAWAQGEIAVGIGGGLSIDIDNDDLYYTPPGSGVGIRVDKSRRQSRRALPPAQVEMYMQPYMQQARPPQAPQSPPIALPVKPNVGTIVQIHYRECFIQTRKTDGTDYQVQRMANCVPKKTPLYYALDGYVRGEQRSLRDLLVYYSR